MSSFTDVDPNAPVIPPKRSSGGSSNDQKSTTNATSNGTMDTTAIFKEASKFDFYHGTLTNREVGMLFIVPIIINQYYEICS